MIYMIAAPGGAKKWRDEHSQYLRGANVVILPDNDATGRAHADCVGAATGIAVRVRVLDLPGLAPKGDVVNWIAARGTTAVSRFTFHSGGGAALLFRFFDVSSGLEQVSQA